MIYGVHLIFEEEFAQKHHCFALEYLGQSLQVGVVEGLSDVAEIIQRANERGVKNVELIPLSLNELKRLIHCYYSIELKNKEIFDRIRHLIHEERFENLFLYVIQNAQRLSASDIHINIEEPYLLIRFRIRGRIVTFCVLDKSLLPTLGRVIKVRGNVDISRSLRPVDGRLEIELEKKLDIRFSIVNTIHGEKFSLRLLDNENIPRSVEALGIEEEEKKQVREMLRRESGAILVTGPTGSGKSTTVRCFLEDINDGRSHIISIEDPIEYRMPGITQIQVDERLHNGFEEGVRSILRQDPDIIFIGEIRDEISAEVAMKASITGHLVFSTLHTKTAELAIERLESLNQEKELIYDSISMIINQRLVGEICEHCKKSIMYFGEEISLLGLKSGDMIFESTGCTHCDYSGISRRVPVLSIAEIKNRQLVMPEVNSLQSKVVQKFRSGKISLEEARRFL